MSWLEIGLIGSIVFAFYYIQQMKMTLKEKGLPVDMFVGWISDYRNFKQLIDSETDMTAKVGYQGILNGLHLSIAGMAIIAVFLFARL